MTSQTMTHDREAKIELIRARAEVKRAAKLAADLVLENAWDTDRYPVDTYAIARTLNIYVIETQIAGDVLGILRKRPYGGPEIYVNADDDPNRRRFTCAHELGHYVQRALGGEGMEEADMSFIDRRADLATQESDSREIYANEFAANLLMPEVSVRSLRSLDMQILELANFFAVSPISMECRLKNLGIL
ncbi:ImmA/IrrE family metallo-endopeptidase [Rhodococcus qingshengii]|uniref:ImmA/IrrE family metallo-endopeptidase n=1 Tax=Rhodococcus qingshengii TaxID=334542 RepID=UPI00287FC9FA|nr:ImmA/IrrE family metallo-endopeptidase [Rhodococcus qingshengii]